MVSFDRYTDTDEMKRYIIYLMKTLITHGVKIETKAPMLLGPYNPTQPDAVRDAMTKAARAAFELGGCAPQIIFVILPGR